MILQDLGAVLLPRDCRSVPSLWSCTRLELINKPIGYDDTQLLAHVLPLLKMLKDLVLVGTGVSVPQAYIFWSQLTALKQPTKLYIGRNGICAEGAKVLGHHLAVLPQLCTLDLDNNDLRAEGAKVLLPYLTTLKQLQRLYLSGNSIGQEGAKVLGPHFAALSQLQILSLTGNNFGDEAVKEIAPHLASLKCLRVLNLNYSITGAGGVQKLAHYVASLPKQVRTPVLMIMLPSLQHVHENSFLCPLYTHRLSHLANMRAYCCIVSFCSFTCSSHRYPSVLHVHWWEHHISLSEVRMQLALHIIIFFLCCTGCAGLTTCFPRRIHWSFIHLDIDKPCSAYKAIVTLSQKLQFVY